MMLMTTRRISVWAVVIVAAMLSQTANAETVLVDEDFQTPLKNNGTTVTNNMFTGWLINNTSGKTRRENNDNSMPGDTTVVFPNQAVELNATSTHPEYDISHNWGATDVYYLMVEVSPSSWNGHIQRWVRPELRQQDGTVLWSTAEDSTTAVPLYDNFGAMTDWPSELRFFFTIDASLFIGPAGQPLRLRLDHSGQRSLYFSSVKLLLNPDPADSTPPTPDPLTWDILPTVSNFIDISMKINSARDDRYEVEYLFTNTVRGTASGWQAERTWVETGLDFGTLYTYKVKARDKSPNQNESTTWSSEQSATTTAEDLTPPTPDPVTWNVVPTVGDYGCITMTANTATDAAGVEYFFTNTVAGTDSGWQDSSTWDEGGLGHDTLYTYKVKARDKSPAQNESTTWSTEESATTPSVPDGTLLITGFQCPVFPNNTSDPGFDGWAWIGDPKSKLESNNGDQPGDDDVSENQSFYLEWTNHEAEYDISHNWSSDDTYLLTLNASPPSWNGSVQRWVRPELRQQDGTVLWSTVEDSTTAVPLYDNFGASTWQAEPDLTFTFTIDASIFSSGTEGQPLRLRLDHSSTQRGMFFDNVNLKILPPPGAVFILE
jgi:hypothetical protein